MIKEIVAIVDEDDNVLATKPRDELTPGDLIRVSILWVENGRGDVLLHQRSLAKKVGPGLWGPAAAGTVESHETYVTNVIKEAEEEIGLTGLIPEEVGKRIYWEPGGPFGRMFIFYRTIVDKAADEFIIKPDEVAQVAWTPKDTILKNVALHPETYVPSAVFWKEMYY